MTNFIARTGGREAMRVNADGVTLHYTYPEEDSKIPEGMRRVTYLEPAEQSNLTLDIKGWTVGCPGNTCDKIIDVTLQNQREEPMTKNFIEVGGTYKSKGGDTWECIAVKDNSAWCVLHVYPKHTAFCWDLNGLPISHAGVKEYELLPPKPKIVKDMANLDRTLDEWFVSMGGDSNGYNGFFYTHTDAKVALFVPLNMDKETLAEAIGALQEEIGDE